MTSELLLRTMRDKRSEKEREDIHSITREKIQK
jgi:hypothetical protein